MKTMIATIVCCFAFLTTKATAKTEQPLSATLTFYYNIKNALVAGDAAAAASQAASFLDAVNNANTTSLGSKEQEAFSALRQKLAADAKKITENKDLAAQRASFTTLSDNMYKLAKAVKLSSDPVYQAYCPMKKAYWLSSEAAIKNPYYGSSMLTCGKVSDTIH